MLTAARPATSPRARRAPAWDSLLYLALLVSTPLWAFPLAGWLELSPVLALLPAAGLLLGLLLARWRALPPLVAHWLALTVAGALALRYAGPWLAPAARGWEDQIEALALRGYRWFDGLNRGQVSPDPPLLAAAFTATAVLLAYAAAWSYFRRGWFWATILPAGLMLLGSLHLARVTSPAPLILYLVGAGALLARCHLDRRQGAWQAEDLRASPRLAPALVGGAALLAALLTAGSWLLPELPHDPRAAAAWESATRPWSHLQTAWNRTVNDLQGQAIGDSAAGFGDSFEVNGWPRLSDEPVARLSGPEPRYLKAVTYDRYTGRGWETTTPESFTAKDSGALFSSQVQLGSGIRLPAEAGSAAPSLDEIEVLRPKGMLLLTPGQFVGAPAAVNVRVGWTQFNDSWFDVQRVDIASLPAVIQPLMTTLRRAQDLPSGDWRPAVGGEQEPAGWGRPLTPAQERQFRTIEGEIARLRQQRGIVVSRLRANPDGRVEAIRLHGYAPRYEDVEAVYAGEPLSAGARYRVLTVASEATAAELQAVTATAPAWVRDRYLALPPALPPRVRELAAGITAGETTPYGRARALETALRALAYDEEVGGPPAGRDLVDYFLFDSRRGYCEYFASAMVVMARSLDIPARVATGYNPGELAGNDRLVRERNAHAWAEVYIAGHGWVAFEPTPSVAANPRGEAPAAVESALGPAAEPTATATAAEPPSLPGEEQPASLPLGGSAWPDWLAPLARAVGLVGLVGVLLAGALGLLWWQGVRGLRGAARWYGRLEWLGRWLGLRPLPATTPHEFARAVEQRAPAAAGAARTIVRLYTQERYAGRRLTRAEDHTAHQAWVRARGALLRRGLRRPRRDQVDSGVALDE